VVVRHADEAVRGAGDDRAAIVDSVIGILESGVGRDQPPLERSRIVGVDTADAAAWSDAVVAAPREAHRAALVSLLDEMVG
jgi:hypothetical protein